MAAGSTPSRNRSAAHLAPHDPETQALVPRMEIQVQWPVFHLMEQPIGGTNVVGGSLRAMRLSRTSRITCFRTEPGSFESSSLPRYRSFRAASKTKKSGVQTAPYASADFWLSSRTYGKLYRLPFARSTMCAKSS